MATRVRVVLAALVWFVLTAIVWEFWLWRGEPPMTYIVQALATDWFRALIYFFSTAVGLPLTAYIWKHKPPLKPAIRFRATGSGASAKQPVLPNVQGTTDQYGVYSTNWSSVSVNVRGHFRNLTTIDAEVALIEIALVRPMLFGLGHIVVDQRVGNGYNDVTLHGSQTGTWDNAAGLRLEGGQKSEEYDLLGLVRVKDHQKREKGLKKHRIRISVRAKEGAVTHEFIDPDWDFIWQYAQQELARPSVWGPVTSPASQSGQGSNEP